jgi:hypothetical protein
MQPFSPVSCVWNNSLTHMTSMRGPRVMTFEKVQAIHCLYVVTKA